MSLLEESDKVPVVGKINFGDFLRLRPMSRDFGISRGTPVDRVYSDFFREKVTEFIQGDCLEIGPVPGYRDRLLQNVDSYKTMDVVVQEGQVVDYLGSISNKNTLLPDSFDTIVAIRVLEHVENISDAVATMHKALKKGGYALVCCTTAQRVNTSPDDFWRPLPRALETLFSSFETVEAFSFGNVLTSVSALMGISEHELPKEAFIFNDEFYPVLSCVIAKK